MIIKAFKDKIVPLSRPHYYSEYVSQKDISPKGSISSDRENELLKQYDERYKNISNVNNN